MTDLSDYPFALGYNITWVGMGISLNECPLCFYLPTFCATFFFEMVLIHSSAHVSLSSARITGMCYHPKSTPCS